jgi:hypothetical protein
LKRAELEKYEEQPDAKTVKVIKKKKEKKVKIEEDN